MIAPKIAIFKWLSGRNKAYFRSESHPSKTAFFSNRIHNIFGLSNDWREMQLGYECASNVTLLGSGRAERETIRFMITLFLGHARRPNLVL